MGNKDRQKEVKKKKPKKPKVATQVIAPRERYAPPPPPRADKE